LEEGINSRGVRNGSRNCAINKLKKAEIKASKDLILEAFYIVKI
jgi:hypothetical protein